MHLLTKTLCDWLYCQRTDQHTKWFTNVSLSDLLISWLNCPGTDQLTEWFMAGWLHH